MLAIVTAPNQVLSEKAKPVHTIDKSIKDFIEQMKKTLDNTSDPEGVGLAAPQVGKSFQIFIVKPTKRAKHEVYINPQINLINTDKKTDKQRNQRKSAKESEEPQKLEGCLSLPRIWGIVDRGEEIQISYLDENGKRHNETVDGFKAVILQHEYDHLQGILFPKRVLEQNGKLYKSSKNKKGEDIFNEIEL